ncbi:hypothetical protein G9A89_022535 [Geosiphon pyriformis]|nr:hypothetical protein G9A89_022535 [Geosiphon pyriformis]
MKTTGHTHITTVSYAIENDMWDNKPCFACSEQLLDEGIWNDILGNWVSHETPITAAWHQTINHLDGYPHDENEIWHMTNTKVEGTMSSKILEIKNNLLEPANIVLIPNPDTFLDLEAGPEECHEHYQNLVLTREEQEQCLAQINIQLCDHCLILCDF